MIQIIVRNLFLCAYVQNPFHLAYSREEVKPHDFSAAPHPALTLKVTSVDTCTDSYPCFASIVGTTKTSFTQHFSRAWAWPRFYLCHLAERCRLVVACAPRLVLVTLQECMPGQTDGILSSIPKRPSAITTQRQRVIVGPLVRRAYRHIGSHFRVSYFPQTPLKSSFFHKTLI